MNELLGENIRVIWIDREQNKLDRL